MLPRTLPAFLLPFLIGLDVGAQPPAAVPGAGGDLGAGSAAASEGPADRGDDSSSLSPPADAFEPGFEGGLRLGIGVPLGNAGRSAISGAERKLSDLITYRAPLWVDIGYRASPAASYGAYAQVGVGGTGDACDGECNWSDIRVGAQGRWRLNPGGSTDPWLGLGVGYEWLSYKTLTVSPGLDPDSVQDDFISQLTERLGGPELLLQAGIEFRVENALTLGPYVSGTLGQFVGDRFKCEDVEACPTGSSVSGSAFHSWIGVGIAGRYAP